MSDTTTGTGLHPFATIIPDMEPPATRTWAGREYPVERWETGYSDQLNIQTDIEVRKVLPPVYIGIQQFSLRDYPESFLNWIEDNSPLEGVQEFAAYLSDQAVTPQHAMANLYFMAEDGSLEPEENLTDADHRELVQQNAYTMLRRRGMDQDDASTATHIICDVLADYKPHETPRLNLECFLYGLIGKAAFALRMLDEPEDCAIDTVADAFRRPEVENG